MKKSNVTKLVALLACLCLMTSAFAGSTLAKYVTAGDAADSARVAKWGVEINTWKSADEPNATSTLFTNDYDTTVTSTVTTDRLVAPGTKNDTGITFSITGKPEVDTKIQFEMKVNNDVLVEAGDYLDWTTANDTDDTFTLDANYTPVKFTLTKNAGTGAGVVAEGTLANIESYLEATTFSKTYEANTDLSDVFGTYTLTWEWVYGTDAGDLTDSSVVDDFGLTSTSPVVNDMADTLLGNVAASIDTETYTTKIDTNINFELRIVASQVD